jgi:hypothetical protein
MDVVSSVLTTTVAGGSVLKAGGMVKMAGTQACVTVLTDDLVAIPARRKCTLMEVLPFIQIIVVVIQEFYLQPAFHSLSIPYCRCVSISYCKSLSAYFLSLSAPGYNFTTASRNLA